MTNHNLEPLAFEVVSATSAHSAHPPSELRRESGNGWQSSPFSDEPLQDIVLEILDDGPCSIHTIELLAHEFLIPQKVEIIIASNDEFRPCKKLGYVAFSKNAESNYSARELKTVSLGGQEANFVKLRLHSPHPNDLNVHNQVALVGLEFIGCSASGSTTREDGSDPLVVDMSQVDDPSEAKEEEEEEGEEDMDVQQEEESRKVGDSSSAVTGAACTSDTCTDSVRSTTGSGNTSTSDNSDRSDDLSPSDTSEPTQSQPALGSNKVTDAKIEVPTTIAISSSSKEPQPPDSPPTESPSPSSSPSKPVPVPSAQEFTERRKRNNDDVQRRLDRLDRIKLELAAVEDFERAARIKLVVDETKKSFSKLSNLETCMRLASEKEDYGEALNLKSQRDTARVEAMHSLEDAENSVAHIIGRSDDRPVFLAPLEVKAQEAREDPIAKATTPPPSGHKSKAMRENTEIRDNSSGTSHGDRDSDSFSIDSAAATSKLHHGENALDVEEEYNEDNHPLKGVPDYMALPAPQNINNEGEGIATDTIARIESLVGSYLTR